jgi:M6 family metalloprotease-like protein
MRVVRSIGRFIAAAATVVQLLPGAAHAIPPTLSSTPPPGLAEALEAGLFALPEPVRGLRAASVQTQWTLPVILASFSDDTLAYGAADFEPLLFDRTGRIPTGSVADYWQWASGGRVTITGRVVATVRLPEDRFYYAHGNRGLTPSGSRNAYGFVFDALSLCESAVNWNEFDRDRDGYVDMLWVVHAGTGGEVGDPNRLLSMTSRMTYGWSAGTSFVTSVEIPGSGGRTMRLDRFTVLPELSPLPARAGQRSEIGVFAHEFGHALGLPDLYDVTNQTNTGPGCWSLMSSGAYGGDGGSPEFPTHPGAWVTQYLGWDRTVRPDRDTLFTLGPIAADGSLVDLWFQGEENPEHFLVEHRRRIGFDRNLPGEGLIVYHVDEAVIGQRLHNNAINSGPTPGLRLIEADGRDDLVRGGNRGDGTDPFPGELNRTFLNDFTTPHLRTFTGSRTQVTLAAITPVPEGMRFSAYVRAPGWLPPQDHSGARFAAAPNPRAARTSGVDDLGRGHVVLAEAVQGRSQVFLRSSENWDVAIQVSASPAQASDPTIAVLPAGDLAVAWSDTRDGPARIYYRARIRGQWTSERVLAALPGSCRSPALGADLRGGLSLAFQYVEGDSVQVRFMRFAYTSPFGMPLRVRQSAPRPENPSVAVEPDGTTWVLWQERTPPQQLWFARFHPDSGLRPAQTLTLPTIYPQTQYSADLDGSELHVVWQTPVRGAVELRYQRRAGLGLPNPIDQLLESSGSGLQNPHLVIDRERRMHIAYERATPNGPTVRYRSLSPGHGWDAACTDLTYPSPYGGSHALLLPRRSGNLEVAYFGHDPGGLRFMVRRRDLDHSYVTAAPAARLPAVVRVAAGPNPLRSGHPLELWSETPGAADVFDLSGRRVASLELHGSGNAWRGRVDAATTGRWTAGVYFVRPRAAGAPAVSFVVLR